LAEDLELVISILTLLTKLEDAAVVKALHRMILLVQMGRLFRVGKGYKETTVAADMFIAQVQTPLLEAVVVKVLPEQMVLPKLAEQVGQVLLHMILGYPQLPRV
jgi:hypothetical protein